MNNRQVLKLKRKSMVDQVSEIIKTAIFDRKWVTGDKLPSEVELSNLYGVNRLTIRLALQKLNTLGLIETRNGEGSFIKEFSISDYFIEISDIYTQNNRLKDICALRKLIELECARLACELATDEDLEMLKNSLDKYLNLKEQYISDDSFLESLSNADMDFHYTICLISHNFIYKDIFIATWTIIKEHVDKQIIKKSAKNKIEPSSLKSDPHKLLYQAIKKRNADDCTRIYLTLLDYLPS
jgi:GntR family transcriptional repressor for pyruvate dehydrogenase complex